MTGAAAGGGTAASGGAAPGTAAGGAAPAAPSIMSQAPITPVAAAGGAAPAAVVPAPAAAAAAVGAVPAAAAPAPGAPQSWLWADGVPGNGDRPSWFKSEKYQSVEKQAAAAIELEKKLGPAAELLGAPEADYVIPAVPQGVEGEFDPKDPLLIGFGKVAKEMGLSQKAYDRVVQYMGGVMGAEAAAEAGRLSESLSQLGQNVPARVDAVNRYLTATLGEPAQKALDASVGTNVAAFQALEALVSKLSGDAQLANAGGHQGLGYTKADIEAERYKVFPDGHKLKGKPMYEHDAEHRKKVDGMWKNLYPGEDRTAVG